MKTASGAPPRTETVSPDGAIQVPALQRGLAMLEFLAGKPEGATLSELTAQLGISIASIFRLAGALEELGYVRREEKSKRYAVTQKLLLLGQPHSGRRSLAESALEPMRRILSATGETTQLCVLAEADCVILRATAVAPSVQVHRRSRLARADSLLRTGQGHPRLSARRRPRRDPSSAEIREAHRTHHHHRKALLVEFERIRACGYAVDRGEHFDGIHCVAAPLLDRHGHTIAAITIAGPATRIPASRFAEIGKTIIAAANDAARRFQE